MVLELCSICPTRWDFHEGHVPTFTPSNWTFFTVWPLFVARLVLTRRVRSIIIKTDFRGVCAFSLRTRAFPREHEKSSEVKNERNKTTSDANCTYDFQLFYKAVCVLAVCACVFPKIVFCLANFDEFDEFFGLRGAIILAGVSEILMCVLEVTEKCWDGKSSNAPEQKRFAHFITRENKSVFQWLPYIQTHTHTRKFFLGSQHVKHTRVCVNSNTW